MPPRCNVSVCVALEPIEPGAPVGDERVYGHYRWPLIVSEREALISVLRQFNDGELRRLTSVTFDPTVAPKWLPGVRHYILTGHQGK